MIVRQGKTSLREHKFYKGKTSKINLSLFQSYCYENGNVGWRKDSKNRIHALHAEASQLISCITCFLETTEWTLHPSKKKITILATVNLEY